MVSGGVGYLIPMLINFLATPLLLRKLGDEAFGLQSLVNVILGYLMVADMGLDIPITKFLAEYTAKGDISNRDKLLSNTLQVYGLIGITGLLIIFFAEPYMYGVFNIPDFLKKEAKIVFWITGIGFFGNIISMWGKSVFIGIQRYDIASGIYIGFSLVSTIVGIVMVYNGMGVVYFVLAKVVGFFLSAGSYLIYVKWLLSDYRFSPGFDKTIFTNIRPLIGYCFLLRFAGMIFGRLDQILISAWVGVAAVGVYSIPFLINTSLTGFISGIMNFTFPKASELYSTNRTEELKVLFTKSLKYVSLVSSYFFSFLIAAGDRFIYLWIDERFATETHTTLAILSLAYFINLVSSAIVNNFVIAMNGMRLFTSYAVIRSVIMAIGFCLLIRPLGIEGAALGVLSPWFVDLW